MILQIVLLLFFRCHSGNRRCRRQRFELLLRYNVYLFTLKLR